MPVAKNKKPVPFSKAWIIAQNNCQLITAALCYLHADFETWPWRNILPARIESMRGKRARAITLLTLEIERLRRLKIPAGYATKIAGFESKPVWPRKSTVQNPGTKLQRWQKHQVIDFTH